MTQPHYIDLASCPFCGSADVEVRDVTDETWKAAFQVACNNCGSRTGIGTHKPEAIAAWNRRPAPLEAVAWREKVAEDLRWSVYTAAYAVLRDYDNHPSKDRGLIIAGDQRIPNLIADSVVSRFQALAVIPTQGGEGNE